MLNCKVRVPWRRSIDPLTLRRGSDCYSVGSLCHGQTPRLGKTFRLPAVEVHTTRQVGSVSLLVDLDGVIRITATGGVQDDESLFGRRKFYSVESIESKVEAVVGLDDLQGRVSV